MLNSNQKADFARDGFLVVPNAITTEQVQWLRGFLRPLFDVPSEQRPLGDTDFFLYDVFSRHPELRWLLWNPVLVGTLRDLLGEDFVFLPEVAAHLNGFGGWHKDTTSQEVHGQKFHWEEDYLMVEAGFYLQDNTTEFGGGLDVEAGSHNSPDFFARGKRTWERGVRRFVPNTVWPDKTLPQPFSVPSKAGDLVIFHFRVNHRASQPQRLPVPPEHEKLALFMGCSRNNRHAQTYVNFLKTRPNYVYLQNFSYPSDLVQEARKQGVTLL